MSKVSKLKVGSQYGKTVDGNGEPLKPLELIDVSSEHPKIRVHGLPCKGRHCAECAA